MSLESAPQGTVTLVFTDADAGKNAELEFSTTDTALVSVNKATGLVSLAGALVRVYFVARHSGRASPLPLVAAGVLLVIGAQAAIVRAAVHDLRRVLQRDCTRLIEPGLARVGFRVPVDERLELAMLRAALAHVHLAISQQDLGVHNPAAGGANATRQFVEDVIGVNVFHGVGGGNPSLKESHFALP